MEVSRGAERRRDRDTGVETAMSTVATMPTDPPKLFTFDVGKTVADIEGASYIDLICAVSPQPREEVRRVLHEVVGLKTLPSRAALTPMLVDTACAQLGISRQQFPFGELPAARYRLRPDAPDAVAAAARCLPVALITNTSVFADPALQPVTDGLAPHLAGVHASWAMGAAKPDPYAFQAAARYHGVTPRNLIHIGNSWTQDVAPVLALGGRAVWLNATRDSIPGSEEVPRGRLMVADHLAAAVQQAIARWLIGTLPSEHLALNED
jgi:FMN phosphatase YigB (HAD superfamily)